MIERRSFLESLVLVPFASLLDGFKGGGLGEPEKASEPLGEARGSSHTAPGRANTPGSLWAKVYRRGGSIELVPVEPGAPGEVVFPNPPTLLNGESISFPVFGEDVDVYVPHLATLSPGESVSLASLEIRVSEE